MVTLRRLRVLATLTALLISGCGYTTQSMLPADVKTVYIAPVKNGIDLSGEIDEKHPFKAYRPGLEVDITNAIINRFVFDGTLKVVPRDKADAILNGTLIDYRRDPLRYSESDEVQESRLSVIVNFSLVRTSDEKPIVSDSTVTGDTSFFIAGAHAISEDEAAARAVDDLAKRVIEKVVEVW